MVCVQEEFAKAWFCNTLCACLFYRGLKAQGEFSLFFSHSWWKDRKSCAVHGSVCPPSWLPLFGLCTFRLHLVLLQ